MTACKRMITSYEEILRVSWFCVYSQNKKGDEKEG
jgi:hypothetical protein